jgi:hypothetical protein
MRVKGWTVFFYGGTAMKWTREQILKMKEIPLQKEVLIPLFKKMGFRDVRPHQGPGEIGKDIVMWKNEEIGRRMNYAVVVKAKKITGKVPGSSSAGQVATQVQQCFGEDYLDSRTLEDCMVHQVFVVTSQEIIPQAKIAIRSILRRSNLDRATTFIDGEALWELIEEHFKDKTVLDMLTEVKQILDDADPDYRIVSTLRSNTISFSIEPKHPEAEEKRPLHISSRFSFPDTPEGLTKRLEFQRFLQTGSEVTIPNKYIEKFDIPDFMKKVLDPIQTGDYQVTMGTLPAVVLVKILMQCDDGEEAQLEYVPLVKIYEDDKRITLSNAGQLVPWRIELILNKEAREFLFNYKFSYGGVNVNWALQGLKFERAMAKGGVFKIKHLETGFDILTRTIEPGLFHEPNGHLIEIIEKLLFIQHKARIPIPAPTNDLPVTEVETIFLTAYKMESGSLEAGDFTVQGDKEFAEDIIRRIENNEPIFLRGISDEVVELLGVTIPMGKAIVTCHNAVLSNTALVELKKAVKSATAESRIPINFKASEDHQITVEYPSWQPNNESQEPTDSIP